jgi:hypothetical protein
MKLAKFLCLALIVGPGVSAYCQVYSGNIVGYYNLQLYAGNNFIANQLDVGTVPDNTLSAIFQPGAVPEGATFTEWDPATQQYLPTSVYDTIQGWSINYTLGFGQGGLLHSPSSFINTIVGSVWSGYDANTGMWVPPLVTGSGSQLLSCYVPIADATFYDVVGRDPQNGESVTWLNDASQFYTTTTFENGVWNNGVPTLNLGQAAFFNLVPVPEPAIYSLIGASVLLLGAARKYVFR